MRRQTPQQHSGRAVTRWNRFCFRLWGPASIGDMSVPARAIDPDPACPRCDQRESAHKTFHTADGKVLRRCPAAA